MSPQTNAAGDAVDRIATGLAGADELLVRYYETRDAAARDALAERYLPFARGLARRFEGRGESLADLIGVASIGLLKAIEGFEPGRGNRFEAYAAPTILGEIRRHFRDRCWAVHVPRGVRDLTPRIGKATERLFADLGRAPTVEELAEALSVSAEDVLDAMEASDAARPASLDSEGRRDSPDGSVLAERVGTTDASYERVEGRVVIEQRLERLTDREREILKMRFEDDLTQSEIGQRVGVSQMQVSRILRHALEELRRE